MSNAPPNGYTIRLVYYGPANLQERATVSEAYEDEDGKYHAAKYTYQEAKPQISTQNIRIVPFPDRQQNWVGIYELVRNPDSKPEEGSS